jgi:hypothetical protein
LSLEELLSTFILSDELLDEVLLLSTDISTLPVSVSRLFRTDPFAGMGTFWPLTVSFEVELELPELLLDELMLVELVTFVPLLEWFTWSDRLLVVPLVLSSVIVCPKLAGFCELLDAWLLPVVASVLDQASAMPASEAISQAASTIWRRSRFRIGRNTSLIAVPNRSTCRLKRIRPPPALTSAFRDNYRSL